MVSRLTQSRGLFRCWRKFVVYPFLVEEFCDSADLRQQPMLPVASHRAMPENRWRWSDRPESGARCGCSSMVEHRPSKPGMGVRFRPPAPTRKAIDPVYAALIGADERNGGGSCGQRGTVRRSSDTLSVASRVGELSETHPKGEDGLA